MDRRLDFRNDLDSFALVSTLALSETLFVNASWHPVGDSLFLSVKATNDCLGDWYLVESEWKCYSWDEYSQLMSRDDKVLSKVLFPLNDLLCDLTLNDFEWTNYADLHFWTFLDPLDTTEFCKQKKQTATNLICGYLNLLDAVYATLFPVLWEQLYQSKTPERDCCL